MVDSRNTDAALKPLLQMCKDCEASNVSTIRTLILKAFTHPEIFSGFDEIKQAVQLALSSAPDGEALLKTLDLFTYGTYKDYLGGSGFMNLMDAQVNKLKMLTVLTLVQRACVENHGVLPYATVAEQLNMAADSLDSLREVEETIIACIYAGIVNGKLCQKTKSLVMSSESGPPCRPRDVAEVSSMLESLKALQKNVEETMAGLEAKKKDVESRKEVYVELNKSFSKEASKPKARAAASAWGSAARELGHPRSTFRRQGKRSRGGPSLETFPRV